MLPMYLQDNSSRSNSHHLEPLSTLNQATIESSEGLIRSWSSIRPIKANPSDKTTVIYSKVHDPDEELSGGDLQNICSHPPLEFERMDAVPSFKDSQFFSYIPIL
jgi:hypothetical protein